LTHTPSAGRTRSLFALERRYAIGLACLFSLLVMLGLAGRASALNYVYDTNQDFWAVNDAAIPGLDTGSIQSTATKSLQGYGGIRMQVDGAAKTPVLNGVMLRGFGDTFDGVNSFSSHHAVALGGVAVTRSLTINQEKNYARFFDTFTNESRSALSVDIDFGGQLGYDQGSHQSQIFTTSSGDATATTADSWVEVDTPSVVGSLASPSAQGPSAAVLGSVPFTQTSDFLVDPFNKPLQTTTDEANEYGYINHFTLQPGQTRSLVHYVVIGLSETTNAPNTPAGAKAGTNVPVAGSQTAAVKTLAEELTATPDLSGLTTGQICSIVNWTEASIKAFKPTYNPAECVGKVITNAPAPVVEQPEPTTNSPYNVVGKSITEELAAMKDGETTSAQITKAYLDRIAAYNDGPLGFHALISVNPHALEEARKDDQLRAEGDTAPLLGIPIAAKDIYDTTEMPTTGGSLVFENYVPEKNSFIVQQLINAGAIIIGKANLSEFANSGFYSASAYGQVWNAFDPSKASIGSSGGSAVAVATNMAAAALGTQTGDSLWGPSSAASLVALRGTDGLTTCQGVMPLTYIQDFCGAITRTTEDQALILNAIATHDPGEFTQELEGAGWEGKRPTDWSSYLKTDALEGKTIGWEDEAWTSPWGDEGTINAMKGEFKYLEAAGAKVIHIANPPTPPVKANFNIKGDTGFEGWLKWIQDHPNTIYKSPPEITNSQLRIPQLRSASTAYTGEGAMSEASIKGFVEYRQAYQRQLAGWMTEQGVDAVVFPGEASTIHLNDSNESSFARETSTGTRIDPQASNAGVPTAIFPAGFSAVGQPDNLQLEGPAFSDPELLGMAYAFENVAHGHQETKVAPALKYVEDGVVTPPAGLTTSPESTTTPPAGSASASDAGSSSSSGSSTSSTPTTPTTTTTEKATAHLDGAIKLTGGKLVATVACTGTTGSCQVILEITSGKATMEAPITVAAGEKKTIKVKPTKALAKSMKAHPKAKLSVRLVAPEGKAKKVKVS
jgi:amidase